MSQVHPQESVDFDFAQIARSIQEGSTRGNSDWLCHSHSAREKFMAGLVDAQLFQPPLPRKSDYPKGIDFYSDLVRSFATSQGHAQRKVLYEPGVPGRWQSIDYAALDRRAQQLAAHWKEQQCAKGASIAVVLPPSIDLLITLCAGLCLGMQIILIPPHGARYVQNRLQVCAECPIWTQPRYLRLLGVHESRVLEHIPEQAQPHDSQGVQSSESHTYDGDAPVLGVFSPLSNDSRQLRSIAASELYAGALRDSLLLGLGTNSSRPKLLLAVDADPVQHAPSLILAALAGGASLLLMESGAAPQTDHLLQQIIKQHTPLVLLLGPLSKDVLTYINQGQLPLPSRCFISPFVMRLLRGQLESWTTGPRSFPVSLLHLDTAAAGAVLWSGPQEGGSLPPLLVAPGCAYRLESPASPGQATSQQSGRLRILSQSSDSDGGLLLARLSSAEEFFLGGTIRPSRYGRRYPSAEVTDLLEEQHGIEAVTVVEQPLQLRARVILLVYTTQESSFRARLLRLIDRELGTEAAPDSLLLVPLYPRQIRGHIDHAFYQSQHEQDELSRVQTDAAFRCLSALRGLLRSRKMEPKK